MSTIVELGSALKVTQDEDDGSYAISMLDGKLTATTTEIEHNTSEPSVTFKNVSLGLELGPSLTVNISKLLITSVGVLMTCVIGSSTDEFDAYLDVGARTITFNIDPSIITSALVPDWSSIEKYVTATDMMVVVGYKDNKMILNAEVEGQIGTIDVTMYMGILPNVYASLSVPEIDLTDDFQCEIANITFTNSEVTIVPGPSTVKIGTSSYKGGITASTNVSISDYEDDPMGRLLHHILGDTSYGKVHLGSPTVWAITLHRASNDVYGDDIKIKLSSIELDLSRNGGTYSITVSVEGSLAFDGIQLVEGTVTELATRTRVKVIVDNNKFKIDGGVTLINPLNIYGDDLVLDSFHVRVASTLEFNNIGGFFSSLIPKEVDVAGAMSVWGMRASASMLLDVPNKQIGISSSLSDPNDLFLNVLGLDDDDPIVSMLELLHVDDATVAYTNMKGGYTANGNTFKYGISLQGSVTLDARVARSYVSENSSTSLDSVPGDEKIIYIMMHLVDAMFNNTNETGLNIAANIDTSNFRRSSLEVGASVAIAEMPSFLGVTVDSLSLGIRAVAAPSIGIVAGMKISRDGYDDVEFKVFLTADTTALSIALNMLGTWEDVFGLKYVSVANLGVMANKTYADIATQLSTLAGGVTAPAALAVLLPSSAGAVGTILIGPTDLVDEQGNRIHPLRLQVGVFLGTDVASTTMEIDMDTSIYSSLAKFIDPIITRIAGGRSLPPEVHRMLGIVELDKVKLLISPDGVDIGDIRIDSGIELDLEGRLVDVPIIEGDLIIRGSLSIDDGFYLRCKLPRIDVPNLITVSGMDDTSTGADLMVDVSTKNMLSSRMYADVMVTILDTFTRGMYMNLSSNGLKLSYIDAIGTSRLEYDFSIDVSGKSIKSAISVNNPMNAIKEGIDGAVDAIVDGVVAKTTGAMADGLNNFIDTRTSAYNAMMDEYDTYTLPNVQRMISDTTSGINSILSDLNVIGSLYSDISTKTVNERDARNARDRTKAELDAKMKAKGYNGGVNAAQAAIDTETRRKNEAESQKRQAQTKKERELKACDSKGWFLAPGCKAEVHVRYAVGSAIAWTIKNTINAANTVINAANALISWIKDSVLSVWNQVKNAAIAAKNALDAAINSAGGLSKILSNAKNSVSMIIAKLKDLFRYKIIYEVGSKANITIGTIMESNVTLAIITFISFTIDGINAAASILGVNIPFAFEVGSIMGSLRKSISDGIDSVKIDPEVFNPRIKTIRRRIDELDAEMSTVYIQMKNDETKSVKYDQLYTEREKLSNRLGRMIDSASSIVMHNKAEDITLDVRSVAAVVMGGPGNLANIIEYAIANEMRSISNATNMATYYLSHGPTMGSIIDTVKGDNDPVIGGISIPSIATIVRYIADNINVYDFKMKGELSLENQFVEIEKGGIVKLNGEDYAIPPLRVDFKDIIMSLIKQIIDWVLGIINDDDEEV